MSTKIANRNTFISIAVMIIFLGGISYLMLQPAGLPHLAREFYKAPVAEEKNTLSASDDSLYETGMAAFAARKWEKAISAFNQADESHPLHNRIIYYMAHAFAGRGEYEKALALFNTPAINNGEFIQETEWNKILMKMFLNHPVDEILPELNELASAPDRFYSNDARTLLKKLKVKEKPGHTDPTK